MAENDALLDAVTGMLPPVMNALEAFTYVGRHLHPQHAASLAETVEEFGQPIIDAREAFEGVEWPEHLESFRDQILEATQHTQDAIEAFVRGARHPNGMMEMFKALRRNTKALESLYPIAAALPPVSRFFIEPEARVRDDLVERAFAGMNRQDRIPDPDPDSSGEIPVGLIHGRNDRHERGGFSLYVPEFYDPSRSWPLVVALHGGSGHGRDFVLTWLREARTRGFLVLAPTSADNTWSMMGGEDTDARTLQGMLQRVGESWNVDPEHRLLTGMSDGATYSLLSGLREGMDFTHFAPISGVMHPDNAVNGNFERVRGRPVYLVHGGLDWMFPVESARMHRDALEAAGADVTYREIDDLSHTYPRDENPKILEWFDPTLRIDAAADPGLE